MCALVAANIAAYDLCHAYAWLSRHSVHAPYGLRSSAYITGRIGRGFTRFLLNHRVIYHQLDFPPESADISLLCEPQHL